MACQDWRQVGSHDTRPRWEKQEEKWGISLRVRVVMVLVSFAVLWAMGRDDLRPGWATSAATAVYGLSDALSEFPGVAHLLEEHPQAPLYLGWMAAGAIAGVLLRVLMPRRLVGIEKCVLYGIVGAVGGATLLARLGYLAPTGLGALAILLGFVGGIILLLVFHLLDE